MDSVWEVTVDGRNGDTGTRIGAGVEEDSFSFHTFSAVKNENKESSTVFN